MIIICKYSAAKCATAKFQRGASFGDEIFRGKASKNRFFIEVQAVLCYYIHDVCKTHFCLNYLSLARTGDTQPNFGFRWEYPVAKQVVLSAIWWLKPLYCFTFLFIDCSIL